jgi:hypothetical protein
VARSASRAALAAALLLAACGSDAPISPAPRADDRPWDAPVEGAVALTEWHDEGQPVGPFGPDGVPWGSPDDLVAGMAEALASTGSVRATGSLVGQVEGDTAVGWVRVEITERGEDGVLARDLRIEMRHDGDSWFVVRTERRDHCARPLVDGDCG